MRNKTPKDQGEPEGPPTGRRRPPAMAHRGPAGGACPYPVGTPLVPSDAYKIRFILKMSGRTLFSTEDIPMRRHLKP